MLIFGIVLAAIVMSFLWLIAVYNDLIQMRENVKNGWSQIDIQLQRRHDLIPNLVEVAKGYMAHERQTLEAVIKARQMAVDASTIKDKLQAENVLTSSLRSLMAVAENYPNLKADAQMSRVMEELTSTENRISFARQYYNDEVNRLNVAIQVFPDSFVASLCKFEKMSFFELQNIEAKQAPQVKF
ncbi:MAG: LemA family protein [Candidatus Omnitrophica bacterium]|nr:LemA family protein [Candidatus Omnitrophota bacterium]